jgi:stage III sporulation protein AB
MLFKIIGSIIVISGTSFLGYFYSKDCGKRPNQLRELQALFQMFENEICFLSNLLIDAFKRIYKSSTSEAAIFFKDTAGIIGADKSIGGSDAWYKAVRANIKNTALNKEDEEILISFGKMLGNSDLEGQVKNIKLTLCQLKLQEQKAEESKKKNEAMYKALGVLGGLAIVIIMF